MILKKLIFQNSAIPQKKTEGSNPVVLLDGWFSCIVFRDK